MPFAITGLGRGSSAAVEVKPADIAAAFVLNNTNRGGGGGEIRQPVPGSIQIKPIGPHNEAVEFTMAADVIKVSLFGGMKVKRRNFYSGLFIPATNTFHCQLDRWEPVSNSTPR